MRASSLMSVVGPSALTRQRPSRRRRWRLRPAHVLALVFGIGAAAVASVYIALIVALPFRLPSWDDSIGEAKADGVVASYAAEASTRRRRQTRSGSVIDAATRNQIRPEVRDRVGNDDDDVRSSSASVHVVFSTDCSGYQHWQGIFLFYSSVAANHTGPITRVASGCDEAQRETIRDEWRRIDPTGRFRVHFTPSFSLQGKKYKYSNKPGGLRHWLRHAVPPVEEPYICVVDPDMVLLRPVTPILGHGLTPRRRNTNRPDAQVEYLDADGVARVLRTTDLADADDGRRLPDRVEPGHPAGQHFGVGGAWASAPHPSRPAWRNFSKANVCGEGSACTKTTRTDADHLFSAGPVYLASKSDWLPVADRWWDFVPLVHEEYPHLLAEMYAFTMAVADLELPFTLVSSYMVSSPATMSPTEAWSWIDDIASNKGAAAVCEGASATDRPSAARDAAALALPTTLHYCQRYDLAGHLFAKRRIPHDFFRCDGEPLSLDVGSIVEVLRSDPSTTNIRTAFMLCNLIPAANTALKSYRRDVCGIQS